jgi:hypothetical protein
MPQSVRELNTVICKPIRISDPADLQDLHIPHVQRHPVPSHPVIAANVIVALAAAGSSLAAARANQNRE